jgi:hypothetical protein
MQQRTELTPISLGSWTCMECLDLNQRPSQQFCRCGELTRLADEHLELGGTLNAWYHGGRRMSLRKARAPVRLITEK